jgi:serine/threonine protein kinase
VFEKVNGGPLLTRIQEHIHFTEREACQIIRDLASALQFLHVKGEFMFCSWWGLLEGLLYSVFNGPLVKIVLNV